MRSTAPTPPAITQDRLKCLFDYDPNTGEFTRRVSVRGARKSVGKLSRGYRIICVDYTHHAAHRLAWLFVYGEHPSMQIDHINGDRADNRIANLRLATNEVNAQNLHRAKSGSFTGVLGVSYDQENKKYRAKITVCGKEMCLGRYQDINTASAAYLAAKRKLHEGCTI